MRSDFFLFSFKFSLTFFCMNLPSMIDGAFVWKKSHGNQVIVYGFDRNSYLINVLFAGVMSAIYGKRIVKNDYIDILQIVGA